MKSPKMKILSLLCLAVITFAGCNEAVKTSCPDIIKPSASLPKTTPWDLKALSKAPEFKWLDQNGPVWSLMYKGPEYKGKPTSVFAYYATPDTLAGKKTDAKFPAVVLVHGGAGKAFDNWAQAWAKRGYAAIAMDLKGHGEGNKRLPDGGPDMNDTIRFKTEVNLPDTDQWSYHDIANVIAAHSLIRSFPDVDKNRTAVTGISWGGYTTCIVAGLDNRFEAAVPVYGCGFLGDNSYWKPEWLDKLDPKVSAKWIRLWDPSMYVGSATMPMFFVNGAKDPFYPLDSYAKTYKLVKSEKNYRIDVNMAHGYQPPWQTEEIGWFIDQYLKGGTPLPKISTPKIAGDKVLADVKSQTKLISASLEYTTDYGPNKERKWHSVKAEISDSKIISPLPPKDVKVWFLTVTDERKAMVSSELMFGK